jgi:hypothetical protein
MVNYLVVFHSNKTEWFKGHKLVSYLWILIFFYVAVFT